MQQLGRLIHLPLHGDDSGQLIALESDTVPFDIKRVYTIFNTQQGISRGFHAHKKLQQLVVCLKGSCQFLLDDGTQKGSFELNQPYVGLLITPGIWREMHHFSPDCILMVLASQPYIEEDYIRDYDTFLAFKGIVCTSKHPS
ncbi:MAG: FdtA/QdtA family cupin domain-containing protein [Candidatus Margulisiibacteriota bacterium]